MIADRKFRVVVKGITPYMQHRMNDEKLDQWEKKHSPVITANDAALEDIVRADFCAYFTGEGEERQYYIPKDHFKGSLIKAGSFTKAKVGALTKSMKTIVAGEFYIQEEKIPLPFFNEIDKRSAVNNNVKGRVIVVRPKWSEWEATFTLLVDNDKISKDLIKEILVNAGRKIGIGSYRPEHCGEFGRFDVVGFEEVK